MSLKPSNCHGRLILKYYLTYPIVQEKSKKRHGICLECLCRRTSNSHKQIYTPWPHTLTQTHTRAQLRSLELWCLSTVKTSALEQSSGFPSDSWLFCVLVAQRHRTKHTKAGWRNRGTYRIKLWEVKFAQWCWVSYQPLILTY